MIQMNWQLKVFAILISFLAPLASVIHVVLILLLVDAITSIYYQMKIESAKYQGFFCKMKKSLQVIESVKLRKTLEKMFFYILILIVFFLFDTFILQLTKTEVNEIYTLSITNIAAVLICIVEMTSIAANVSKITGNPIFNKIVAIFKKKAEAKMEIGE